MTNYFVLVNGVRTNKNYGYADAAHMSAFGLSLNPDTITTVIKEDDNGSEEIIGTYRAGEYGAADDFKMTDDAADEDAGIHTIRFVTYTLCDRLHPFEGEPLTADEIAAYVREEWLPSEDNIIVASIPDKDAAIALAKTLTPTTHLYKKSEDTLIVNCVMVENEDGEEIYTAYAAFDGESRGKQSTARELVRYCICDQIDNGDTFDRVFDADSYEAALDIARSEWIALSEHDKARRSEFLFGVVSAEAVAACEDGMDSLLNYMTNVVNLKEEV